MTSLRLRRAAALTTGALIALLGSTSVASASAPVPGQSGATTITGVFESPRPAFYEPPATIPAAGRVIRTENAPLLLDPLGLSSVAVRATRVMYASKDRAGRPVAVTGTVFAPTGPWIGLGQRPIISYAPGTQGMADRCAPSRQLAETITEYEGLLIPAFLARGFAVVMTDYQGLGTPGSHTYMVRAAQGRAVLDAARAARRLLAAPSAPIGIMGYSQGGGAAAAAAELAATYAPDLAVKGTVAGAVPADLAKVGDRLDGSFWAAFSGYGTIGLAAAYDIDPAAYLSPQGIEIGKKLESGCVIDAFGFSFMKSTDLTKDGRPMSAYFAEEPFTSILAENRIGRRSPSAPVLLVHSALDDTIPYAVGRQLMRDWCARGVNASFSTNGFPLHIGGIAPYVPQALGFFEARFAGLPQISNCWIYG